MSYCRPPLENKPWVLSAQNSGSLWDLIWKGLPKRLVSSFFLMSPPRSAMSMTFVERENLLIVGRHLRRRILPASVMILDARVDNSHWHDIYVISWVYLCLWFGRCCRRWHQHFGRCTVLLLLLLLGIHSIDRRSRNDFIKRSSLSSLLKNPAAARSRIHSEIRVQIFSFLLLCLFLFSSDLFHLRLGVTLFTHNLNLLIPNTQAHNFHIQFVGWIPLYMPCDSALFLFFSSFISSTAFSLALHISLISYFEIFMPIYAVWEGRAEK